MNNLRTDADNVVNNARQEFLPDSWNPCANGKSQLYTGFGVRVGKVGELTVELRRIVNLRSVVHDEATYVSTTVHNGNEHVAKLVIRGKRKIVASVWGTCVVSRINSFGNSQDQGVKVCNESCN